MEKTTADDNVRSNDSGRDSAEHCANTAVELERDRKEQIEVTGRECAQIGLCGPSVNPRYQSVVVVVVVQSVGRSVEREQ